MIKMRCSLIVDIAGVRTHGRYLVQPSTGSVHCGRYLEVCVQTTALREELERRGQKGGVASR
jgi:hypothetical protein